VFSSASSSTCSSSSDETKDVALDGRFKLVFFGEEPISFGSAGAPSALNEVVDGRGVTEGVGDSLGDRRLLKTSSGAAGGLARFEPWVTQTVKVRQSSRQ
jgi:hypothetical protein